MKIISISILIIMLIISTIKDIKSRHISIIPVGVIFIIGIILLIINVDRDIIGVIFGVAIGIILIIISKITKGQIGTGDGLIMCVTGVYLGMPDNIILLFNSLILAAIYSAILLIIKKVDKKKAIPFVPFILIAYVGMVIF